MYLSHLWYEKNAAKNAFQKWHWGSEQNLIHFHIQLKYSSVMYVDQVIILITTLLLLFLRTLVSSIHIFKPGFPPFPTKKLAESP